MSKSNTTISSCSDIRSNRDDFEFYPGSEEFASKEAIVAESFKPRFLGKGRRDKAGGASSDYIDQNSTTGGSFWRTSESNAEQVPVFTCVKVVSHSPSNQIERKTGGGLLGAALTNTSSHFEMEKGESISRESSSGLTTVRAINRSNE
jgi:hypothetical protein